MACDDEKDILLMFQLGLEKDYRVITTESGKECIEKYLAEKAAGREIDLLLLDYKLGDMPGDEVARKIKKIGGTKILLITAFDLDQAIIDELLLTKSIIGTIRKPVMLQSLLQKIKDTV